MVLSLVLVFAAGASVGWLIARRPPGPRSWLADELHLTAEQREQMQAIWSQVMGRPRDEGERRAELAQKRDDAIRHLLTDEQSKQYDQIQTQYQQELLKMADERRAAFEQAEARTKEILTPAQREKYEAMLSRMRESEARHPRRPGPPGGPFGRPGEGGRPPGAPLPAPPPGPPPH